MGLDIYFYKHRKGLLDRYIELVKIVSPYRNTLKKQSVRIHNFSLEKCEIEHELQEESSILYYRKLNLLMERFGYTDFLDFGKTISEEEIKSLVSDCETVLKDHSQASSLLPTMSGFFFGSTEYSNEYYGDVAAVMEDFTKLLNDTDFTKEEIVMYADW